MRPLRWLLGASLAFGAVSNVAGQDCEINAGPGQFKLLASDRQGSDCLGGECNSSGAEGHSGVDVSLGQGIEGLDYAVAGAFLHDTPGGLQNEGAGYLFRREADGASWTEVAILLPQDHGSADSDNGSCGRAVGVGVYAALGCPGDDGNGTTPNSGAVYRFDLEGDFVDKLNPVQDSYDVNTNNDQFGFSLDYEDSDYIVGAPQDDGRIDSETKSNSGSAYINGQKVFPAIPQGNARFGNSVAIAGDRAIVGSPLYEITDGANTDMVGSAYVFEKGPQSTQYSQSALLIAPDGAHLDRFGSAVDIDGDYAVVGAFQDTHTTGQQGSSTGEGSAYVFHRTESGWNEVQKIVAPDPTTGNYFGVSVSISGDTIAIGSSRWDQLACEGSGSVSNAGKVYVYRRTGPNTWEYKTFVTPASVTHARTFGSAVGIADDTLIVGAPGSDETAGDTGAAFIDYISPCLIGATSRKTHQAAGPFDINLSPMDQGVTEPRADGPTEVVLVFSQPIFDGDDGDTDFDPGEGVTASAGTITGLDVNGNELLVSLTGVPDLTCLTLTLEVGSTGIVNDMGYPLTAGSETEVIIRSIKGDVNDDHVVNIVDLSEVKAQLFMAVGAGNFKDDVNYDGVINIVDLNDVKANLFHQLLTCP